MYVYELYVPWWWCLPVRVATGCFVCVYTARCLCVGMGKGVSAESAVRGAWGKRLVVYLWGFGARVVKRHIEEEQSDAPIMIVCVCVRGGRTRGSDAATRFERRPGEREGAAACRGGGGGTVLCACVSVEG